MAIAQRAAAAPTAAWHRTGSELGSIGQLQQTVCAVTPTAACDRLVTCLFQTNAIAKLVDLFRSGHGLDLEQIQIFDVIFGGQFMII